MTELSKVQQFLTDPSVKANNNSKKIQIFKNNKWIDIEIRALTNKEYNISLEKSRKRNSDGTISYDLSAGDEYICVQGIINPDFKEQAWINYTNKTIQEYNKKLKEEIQKEYDEAVEKYEKTLKEGGKASRPTKRKAKYIDEVVTANDLLKYIFFAGEIRQICDKIIQFSGFNSNFVKEVEEAKNS